MDCAVFDGPDSLDLREVIHHMLFAPAKLKDDEISPVLRASSVL
jgi:hypothetical protein